MDRNFVPLDVSRAAALSRSHPLTLFLLQRRFLAGDRSVIPDLLETVVQTGKLRAYHRRAGRARTRFSGLLGNGRSRSSCRSASMRLCRRSSTVWRT
jgi:hypothetical protein